MSGAANPLNALLFFNMIILPPVLRLPSRIWFPNLISDMVDKERTQDVFERRIRAGCIARTGAKRSVPVKIVGNEENLQGNLEAEELI